MQWYNKVSANPDDLSVLADAMDYYELQLVEARKELKTDGKRLELIHKTLPGMAEYRFNQLQEVEAILKMLELKLNYTRSKVYKGFLENYNRALSSRDAEKYCDADQNVYDLSLLLNRVALIRNSYLGISKGIEMLHFQIGNVTKLRVAGMEDASL